MGGDGRFAGLPTAREAIPAGRALAFGLGSVLLVVSACTAAEPDVWEQYALVVAAEDARGRRPTRELAEELAALGRRGDPRARAWAVRGIGRLGDPGLAELVLPFLGAASPDVRVAAVHAVAALAPPGGGSIPAEAERRLRGIAADPEEGVGLRVEAAFALARASRTAEEGASTDSLLAGLVDHPAVRAEGPVAAPLRVTLARAWELRARRGPEGWSDEVAGRGVRALADLVAGGGSVADIRARRLAVAALRVRGGLTGPLLAAALDDADAGVRRTAVGALDPGVVSSSEEELMAALGDPDGSVRLEAVRRYDGWLRALRGCGPLLDAVDDPDPHVALAALDLLVRPCPDHGAQRGRLLEVVEADGWHRRAHALVALAAVAPDDARPFVARAVAHPNPFMRSWGARAAAGLGDESTLRRLTEDADPNVRTAALQGLGGVVGDGADDAAVHALSASDAQLVLAAVALLEDTPRPVAARTAMTAALRRFTAARTETSRDVRLALLDGLDALGGFDPSTLRPLLADHDRAVAGRAAGLIESLTGAPVEPEPRRLDPLPTPTGAELEHLSRTVVILDMEGGGEIAIRLRPSWAATNAARFARLVRDGRFDGLTFHRVVPNFIIQGGSSGANEYAGRDLYTRDEVGRASHRVGTVGVSTRGPDTGDGQIFVNVVDNPRLDFTYTVFGEIVRGLDVARAVLEGDVILRARVEDD